MTMRDNSSGPPWLTWVIFVCAVIAAVILTGHGANLVAGYNTATEEEKSRYDRKKMCRVVGAGMAVIAVMIFISAAFEAVLPAAFAKEFLVLAVVICITLVVLVNTICRK